MSTAAVDLRGFGTRSIDARAVQTRAAQGRVTQSPAAPSHLRLTKRGRRVLLTLAVLPLVIGALAFALNGGGAAATDTSGSTRFEYVTVDPGESLWQLAGEIAPSADPREVISEIVQLNQLDGSVVQAGQRLALPTKYSH